MLLPVGAIELFHFDILESLRVQASNIDAETVRVGAGHIKRFDPAMAAKQVFCSARVEAVLGQIALALEQMKPGRGNDQM